MSKKKQRRRRRQPRAPKNVLGVGIGNKLKVSELLDNIEVTIDSLFAKLERARKVSARIGIDREPPPAGDPENGVGPQLVKGGPVLFDLRAKNAALNKFNADLDAVLNDLESSL